MAKKLETLQQGSNIVELVLLDTDAVLYVQGIPVTPCTSCTWECDTVAGPESGSDTFTCSRCGDTYSHIYY